MCAVSNVGDQWNQKFSNGLSQQGGNAVNQSFQAMTPMMSHYEFEQLKAEVLQMKAELAAAKRQDEIDGSPDCEMEEKIATLKAIAKLVGVNLEDIFKSEGARP